ncbi:enoyl-CoA hydratase [Pseudoxanthomonas kalamensis DSM 18571]|uniref:enoyl-CoA hydratase/isomerase family protein n=1 Tax=Pseudoxanthomonas kalamensis TaxID=289483 RepID=UPI0013906F9B|nr:enoyl-CoA hydratase/isomerase family protein [Pseudoxanthomonas kalamensis]KAF1711462.1 enoyl-CoA hydratase [Pseudoxanthomonas kalamensis DSM 18571]
MNATTIAIERRNAVATLWLDRPEVHNAFDEHLIAAITTGLRELDADDTVRVVVLAGRGKSFCAGGDLDWMRRMAAYDEAANLEDAGRLAEMLRTLATLSKPTVARVHGAALAGGTGLVAACDIAVAGPRASFGTTEVRLGLVPATIGPYVVRAIGPRAARRYFLTGERIDAQRALQLGLVHELCGEDELDQRIDAIVKALLAGAPGALHASKRLLDAIDHQPLSPALIEDTCRRIATARASEEAREGIAAFFDKRKPAWADDGTE